MAQRILTPREIERELRNHGVSRSKSIYLAKFLKNLNIVTVDDAIDKPRTQS